MAARPPKRLPFLVAVSASFALATWATLLCLACGGAGWWLAAQAAAPSGKAVTNAPPIHSHAPSSSTEKGIAGKQQTQIAKTNLAPRPYHNVFVLSIGVNSNPGFGNLNFATNDAAEIGRVCNEKYGFQQVTTLLDTNATKARIYSELDRIQRAMAAATNDDFILFFSGHGHTKPVSQVADGRTNVERHGFLVPYDPSITPKMTLEEWRNRGLDMSWLTERMISLPARHRLLFLDSCFSGLAFATHAVIRKPPEDLYREVIQQPTVQVLTAGLDSEVALEHPGLQHGIFSYALLRQMQNSGVRTMEEIFFPLRAEVRDEVHKLTSDGSMTPQHRYLKYDKGTFVFVPADQVDQWADQKPAEPSFVEATRKGYFEPVETAEITSITNVASNSNLQNDPSWQQRIDRYEARASMGDANAMAALAKIYGAGLGTTQNTRRAQLWAQEGRETFAFSKAFNIKDPVAASLVDAFLNNGLGGQNFQGGALASNANANQTVAMAAFGMQLAKVFGGDGGANTADELEKRRGEVVRDLENKRYREALQKLNRWEQDLKRVTQAGITAHPPPQYEQITALVTKARRHIELNLRPSAIQSVDEAGRLLREMKQQLESAPKPQ
ncbi:MAG: caspase family protein [Verrucomicrobiota bacterium]